MVAYAVEAHNSVEMESLGSVIFRCYYWNVSANGTWERLGSASAGSHKVFSHLAVLLDVESPVAVMFIRLSSRLHMSDVSFPLSAHSSILLSLLTSVFLLTLIRAALLFLRSWTSSSSEKQTLVHVQHQKNVEQQQQSSSPISALNWRFNIFSWENLPALPVSFKFSEKDMKGQGVSLVAPQQLTAENWQPGRRSGPAFEHPRTFFIELRLPSSYSVTP